MLPFLESLAPLAACGLAFVQSAKAVAASVLVLEISAASATAYYDIIFRQWNGFAIPVRHRDVHPLVGDGTPQVHD